MARKHYFTNTRFEHLAGNGYVPVGKPAVVLGSGGDYEDRLKRINKSLQYDAIVIYHAKTDTPGWTWSPVEGIEVSIAQALLDLKKTKSNIRKKR